MEHFPIVQALCRLALATPDDAIRHQVARLRDALRVSGATDQADALSGLLTPSERSAEMSPTKLTRALAFPGEELTPRTPVPVDRETSTPLAHLLFPADLPQSSPLMTSPVAAAVESLLEEWRNALALSAVGVVPASTCLIYGDPGTGKTKLALWVARQLGLPVVLARLDGLVSSFLGTSSRNIGALFNFAARYNCLLLLDEFDAVAKLRDDPQEVGEIKRVVNTLLQNLDTRRTSGLTIGITNHQQLLDPAVWRRFEMQVEVPRPSYELRLEIVRHYLPPLGLPEAPQQLLAWATEGATGSEIETLVRSAKKASVLAQQDRLDVVALLRRLVAVNGGRFDPSRRAMLQADNQELAQALLLQPELSFDQSDLATVFGKDKATISRWVRPRRDGGGQAYGKRSGAGGAQRRPVQND